VDINVSSSSSLGSISAHRIRPKSNTPTSTETSKQELQEIRELKARDREVRAHEAAHIASGGSLVNGHVSFSYQRGPDGIQYAIGGEVSIDISKVSGDPEATLQKAQQIQAAALAPAQPSSQDRAVAAKAAKMAVEARAEINKQSTTEAASAPNQPTPFSSSNSDSLNSLDLNV